MGRFFHVIMFVAFLAVLAILCIVPASAAQAVTQGGTRAETVGAVIDDSAVIRFAQPAEYVAAYWQGDENARVSLSFSTDGIDFAEPVDAGRDDAGEDLQGDPWSDLRDGTTYGAVLAAEGAVAVRVTTDTPLARLNLVGISPEEPVILASGLMEPAVDASAGAAAGVSATLQVMAAQTGQPTLISRSGWGADAAYLNWAPQFYPAKKVIVHHTADGTSPDGSQESYARLVRSIYYYHAVTRDWGDIAYNFLIDPLGNIYEGRYSDDDPATLAGEDAYGNGVRGGHTYNYNTGTVGIAVLGTYATRDISPEARASLEILLAWLATRHGIDPLGSDPYYSPFSKTSTIQTWNITGHRDYGSTDCPGDVFYASLPGSRQDVFDITGPVIAPTPAPTYVRIDMSPDSPHIGQQVTVTATLMGEASRLPVPGQTISFATGGIATTPSLLGMATTDLGGVATIHMTFMEAGMRWVTADFHPGPSSAYRGSTTSAEVNVAPTGLSASPGNTQVRLSWDAAPGASGYNLYRDGVKVNSTPILSTTYLDSGLMNDATYSYQVSAMVSGRESAKSSSVSGTPSVALFLDVPVDHPYYVAIQGLAAAGVVNGKTDGGFHPDELVTRQQFAKMIVLGCDYLVSESNICLFKDVTKSGPGSLYPDNYVAVCAAHKITLGKTATTFDPHTNITRAQVATMVVRAAQDRKSAALLEPPLGWEGVLPASDPTHGTNIARAEYSGFLSGIDLSSFSVTGKATRGEIAQIVWNLMMK